MDESETVEIEAIADAIVETFDESECRVEEIQDMFAAMSVLLGSKDPIEAASYARDFGGLMKPEDIEGDYLPEERTAVLEENWSGISEEGYVSELEAYSVPAKVAQLLRQHPNSPLDIHISPEWPSDLSHDYGWSFELVWLTRDASEFPESRFEAIKEMSK